MIDVAKLSKHYGPVPAVSDVSFSVNSGEIVGFLGPNGAGKTTTMRVLTGFTPATSGRAVVAGHDVSEAPLEVKRRVGYLPESVPLYTEMVVRSFLHYVAEVKGIARSRRKAEVSEVMERVGLQGMGHRPIGHLSKGYRQRVGLAQALLGSPPVLILDEPTVGLDPRQIIEIRELIKGLAPAHTVLLSTHILPEVQMICERVVIIHQGRIIAEESLANLAGSGSGSSIVVGVRGDETKVEALLKSIEGIVQVSRIAPARFRVQGDGASELPDRIARRLFEGGFGLDRLEPGTRTLEEIFVEAVSRERTSAS